MQAGFWKADWFLGVVVVAAFALFSSMSELVPSLERKAYDAALLSASRTPSDKVAIIAIDKQSIDNIGRWPWSRDTHARMIDLLVQAKARVPEMLASAKGDGMTTLVQDGILKSLQGVTDFRQVKAVAIK